MSQYGTMNLAEMRGQVAAHKRNTNPAQVDRDINARIRAAIDYRPFWAALLKRVVVSFPNAYTTGGVSLTTGSTSVIGTNTSWPVSDLVNTVSPVGVRDIGYNEVTPASMAGIVPDCLLYLPDAQGANDFSEVVAVTDVTNTTFTAEFKFRHNAGFALTRSSLAGLQLRVGSFFPVYTVTGIVDPETAILDSPFGGASLSNAGYNLLKAYTTIDDRLKDILDIWDPIQGIPLAHHVNYSFLANVDAQRGATGNPQAFVDFAPGPSGSMQYEVWPYQLSSYEIPVLIVQQWPVLKRPTDRPPWFINPSIFIDGAIADALRRKDLKNANDKDPYFDPTLAREFEAKWQSGLQVAASADESKCLRALDQMWGRRLGPGASYWQSHVDMGDWGGDY